MLVRVIQNQLHKVLIKTAAEIFLQGKCYTGQDRSHDIGIGGVIRGNEQAQPVAPQE